MTRQDRNFALSELRADEVNRLRSALAWRRGAMSEASRVEARAVARRTLGKIRALDALMASEAEAQESNSMACEEPPPGCQCSGCSYAREVNA